MAPRLHQLAEDDTPSRVQVPATWSGLLVWAVGRFGVGILMAAACGWALMRVYEDLSTTQRELMQLLRDEARAKSEMTVTLNELRQAIAEVSRESRNAHTKGGGSE